MKKLTYKIVILAFLSTLFFPLILQPFSINNSINWENRKLAQFPEIPQKWSDAKKIFSKLDNYLKDNIPLRPIMISLYNTISYQIGVSPTKNIIFGKKDWLFNNSESVAEQQLGRKVLDKKEVVQNCKVLIKNSKYFSSRNIPFYFFVAPDKHTIYKEYLPNYFNNLGFFNTNFNKIDNHLNQKTNLKPIDIRAKLLEMKPKNHLLYYKLDSHWNELGGFIAYREIMDVINSKRENKLTKLKYKKNITIGFPKKFKGSLYKRLGVLMKKLENVPYIDLEENKIIKSKLIGSIGAYKAKETRIITTSTLNAPTLLLIRDSFSDAMIRYYAHSFSKIILVHHEYGDWNTKILKDHKPDIVIFEMVERYLGKNFKDTNFNL